MTSHLCLPKLKLRGSARRKRQSQRDVSKSELETIVNRNQEIENTPSTSQAARASPHEKHEKITSPRLKRNDSFLSRLTLPRFNRRNNSNKKFQSKYVVKYQKVFGEEDCAYKNCSTPRGKIFVYNFETFDNSKSYPKREGSTVDYINIIDVFHQMGYGNSLSEETFCRTGHITKDEFMDKIIQFSQHEGHKDHDSCIVIIMSHGYDEKSIVTSDNQKVSINDICSLFENVICPHLAGKPKVFIFQYCRKKTGRNGSREYKELTKKAEENKIKQFKKDLETKVSEKIEHLQSNYKQNIEQLNAYIAQIRRESGIDDDSFPSVELRSPRYFVEEPIPKEARLSNFSKDCAKTANECSSILDLNQSQTSSKIEDNEKFRFPTNDALNINTHDSKSSPENINNHDSKSSPEGIRLTLAKDETDAAPINYHRDGRAIIANDCMECYNPQRISDIYIIQSTTIGDDSYRDVNKGSILIQSLCHVLAENAYQDDIDNLLRKASIYKKTVLQKKVLGLSQSQTFERTNTGFDKLFYFNPIATEWERFRTV